MRKFLTILASALLLVAMAIPAGAWDVSDSFYSNATETIDLSSRYAAGETSFLQFNFWTNATSDLTSDVNATISCSGYGSSAYELAQVEFMDGTSSGTNIYDLDNATDPTTVRLKDWACDGVLVTPDAVSTVYTINYVITGR